MESAPSYSLKWNNHTQSLLKAVEELYNTGTLTDVTIAVIDSPFTIKCHKIVLVACSSYFRDIILRNETEQSEEHLIICLEAVKFTEIKMLLEFMYNGEVRVDERDLKNVLNVATRLRVKGLEMQPEEPDTPSSNDEDDNNVTSSPEALDFTMSPEYILNALSTQWDNGPTLPDSMCPQPGNSVPFQNPGYPGPYEDNSPFKFHHYFNRDIVEQSILQNILGPGFPENAQAALLLNSLIMQSQQPPRRKNPRSENRLEKSDTSTEAEYAVNGENHEMNPSQMNHPMTAHAMHKKWKRYKKYSQENLEKALSDVKNGVQTLVAAQKYGVPSRTLYDKIKRLGIKTERATKRGHRSGENRNIPVPSTSESACFPFGVGYNVDGSIYNRNNYSDSENDISALLNFDIDTSRDTPEIKPEFPEMMPKVLQITLKEEESETASESLNEDEIGVQDLSVKRESTPPIAIETVKNENLD